MAQRRDDADQEGSVGRAAGATSMRLRGAVDVPVCVMGRAPMRIDGEMVGDEARRVGCGKGGELD